VSHQGGQLQWKTEAQSERNLRRNRNNAGNTFDDF
jgi:hypothetical protein